MHAFMSTINPIDTLNQLDWCLLAIILCCNVCVIFYARQKQTRANSEYLLMNRSLSLPLFVATLVSSSYGGIFGVTQIAFEQGIYNFFTQGLFWYIAYIIFALFLVKKIRNYNALTLPNLIEKMYGKNSAIFGAILIFIKTLPVVYAISIGLLLQIFFSLSLINATCIGLSLVTAYAIYGGFRSIVFTHTYYIFFMYTAIISVLVFSILQFGGLDFLQQTLPPTYFKPHGSHALSTMLVWFCIACGITFISPTFYQHCFAAKSDQTAKRGILFSTGLWFIFDICTTLGAMYAKAIIPVADSLHAYIIYGIQVVPAGFKGLFIAGIIATVLANLDAKLFVASNTLFYDLPMLAKVDARYKRTFALFLTISCTLLLAHLTNSKIETIWFTLKSYYFVCLLMPILLGYFFPYLLNTRFFIINCLLCVSSMFLWDLANFNFVYIERFFIGFATNLLLFLFYRYKRLTTVNKRVITNNFV